MRKTYRLSSVKDYWDQRWSNIAADEAMVNIEKYPLACARAALSQGNYKNKAIKILEAGCGNGRLLRYFHGQGYDIVGIDFIQTAIEKIQDADPSLQAEVGDIKSLRFPDGFFSHVLAFGLYHNFEEEGIKTCLEETHRVLEPGGILCASFRADNVQNLINDTFFSRNLGYSSGKDRSSGHQPKQFHKINLKRSEVYQFLEEQGFSVLEHQRIDNMPFLYKLSIFRVGSQKEFDEQVGRTQGYLMNRLGRLITLFLKSCFAEQFFNLHVVVCERK